MHKTEAPSGAIERRHLPDTKSGASFRLFKNVQIENALRLLAPILIFASSATWLAVILAAGVPSPLFPWFVSIAMCTLLALAWAARPEVVLPPEIPRAHRDQRNTLIEWLSVTYLSASMFFLSTLAALPPFESIKPLAVRQIIDIELTSNADYADNKDLLPGTEPKEKVGKRTGAVKDIVSKEPVKPPTKFVTAKHEEGAPSQAAAFTASKQKPKVVDHTNKLAPIERATRNVTGSKQSFFIAQEPSVNSKMVAHAETKTEVTDSSSVVLKNFPWRQYTSKTETFLTTRVANSGGPIEINEVRPPEMMEVTDNDGEIGKELWQAGGRSAGGKGAKSALAAYLKEMHRKLKRAWSPPSGTSRRAQIQFRLKRDGSVAAIKLIASSGDSSVDQSALSAVSQSAPFGTLPKEYEPDNLDVRYTFNYRADTLSELAGQN
jgi:TonB family protein